MNRSPSNTGRPDTGNSTEHDIAQREARILGAPPRIAPLRVDELTDDLLAIVERMIKVNAALESRDQKALTDLVGDPATATSEARSALLAGLSEIVRTMLRHSRLFAHQVDLGIQLLAQGTLAPRDREIAILRIAWLCQAPYEWGEHVHVAKKVGVSSAEIERITVGSNADGWSDHDRAILKATDELHADAMISDATWAALAQRLDERQLIELPIVVGQYQTVAYYQNSLRLRLHEGNLGLKAR